LGLSASIKASFVAREPPLICFSRRMALYIVSCSSCQTSNLQPYRAVKPGIDPSRC
jgi:hypothetical protein